MDYGSDEPVIDFARVSVPEEDSPDNASARVAWTNAGWQHAEENVGDSAALATSGGDGGGGGVDFFYDGDESSSNHDGSDNDPFANVPSLPPSDSGSDYEETERLRKRGGVKGARSGKKAAAGTKRRTAGTKRRTTATKKTTARVAKAPAKKRAPGKKATRAKKELSSASVESDSD